MNLFSVLNANNYVTFNRELAHAIGLNAALVLSEVLDKWELFKKNNQLISLPDNPGEWFYLPIEDMQLRITLGEKEQRNAIEVLMEMGFIEVIRKGIPPRRHFRVIEENILEFFQIKNNFYNSSQKPNSTLPLGGIESSQKPNPIYKNPTEDPKEEIPPNPQKGEKEKYGSHVELSKKEYEDLVATWGKQVVEAMIAEMNDWHLAKGKNPYKDYAAALRQWIRKRETDGSLYKTRPVNSKDLYKKNKELAERVLEKYYDLHKQQRFILGYNYIEFYFGENTSKIIYTDNGFEEQVFNCLRRMNVGVECLKEENPNE